MALLGIAAHTARWGTGAMEEVAAFWTSHNCDYNNNRITIVINYNFIIVLTMIS